jgi:pyridoxamine 5'-phosphate oxidase
MKVRLDTSMASREDISAMRRQYGEVGLIDSALPKDPVELFNIWLDEAASNEVVVEANAMVLSTSIDNQPSSRTVLLKDLSADGFTFLQIMDPEKQNK